jgi:hypothetical protein
MSYYNHWAVFCIKKAYYYYLSYYLWLFNLKFFYGLKIWVNMFWQDCKCILFIDPLMILQIWYYLDFLVHFLVIFINTYL